MNKNDKLIMVVKKEILFGDDYFKGFRAQNELDYELRILKNFRYIKRNLVEDDPTYKQPIGYSMIINPTLRQIFAYQRSTQDTRYPEKRLQGKWSWGVGGHIEKLDVKTGNPIRVSVLRELEEEIGMDGSINLKVLGYINNDTDEVGKVHFGVLYIVETDSRIVRPKDPEIDNGKLRTIEELEEICSSPEFTVEEWSRISFNPLREYLK